MKITDNLLHNQNYLKKIEQWILSKDFVELWLWGKLKFLVHSFIIAVLIGLWVFIILFWILAILYDLFEDKFRWNGTLYYFASDAFLFNYIFPLSMVLWFSISLVGFFIVKKHMINDLNKWFKIEFPK